MKDKEKEYIEFDDFVNMAGLKKATIIKNYKKIPGIERTDKGYRVLSGTRYLFTDIHKYKMDDAYEKRYVLLRAISRYKYIGHKELRIEKKQFEQMLTDLISADLIKPNNLSNNYGANAYDCTERGAMLVHTNDYKSKIALINVIAEAAGNFTGAIISQVYDVV